MKRYLPIFLLLLLAFILGAACNLPTLSSWFSDQSTEIKPTSTSTVQVLFQDNFSDPASGWSVFSDSDGSNDYESGGYRIFVNKPNWYFWSNPGVNYTDVVIEVDATKVTGPEENDFGVICRYQDENNFYLLVLGSDGYYGISKVINGEEQLVGMEELQLNDMVIKPGDGATNHIKAECAGERLTLLANGQVLADVRDQDLKSGDIGLIAGTYDDPGVDILFDNLIVTRP